MPPSLDRTALLDDPHLVGAPFCKAYSDLVDAWLSELYDLEVGGVGGVALVAVGGYGRAELCPQSDIDLLLLHRGSASVAEIAERIWYPIWDANLKLGHAVRTPKEALTLAADDLETATALLSMRTVVGDADLVQEVADGVRASWQKRSKYWLEQLARTVRERHAASGEVAFMLEPDLKDGRGGLRDVHAVRWAEQARPVLLDDDAAMLAEAYDTILTARVELHRVAHRPGDQLVLEEQDGVAEALGYTHPDDLMRAVSAAARRIAWTCDEVWDRLEPATRGLLGRRASRDRSFGGGVSLRDGVVVLDASIDPAGDVLAALRVAVAAATNESRIDRETLHRLASRQPQLPERWPDEARALFVELLLQGAAAIPVIEALDQTEVWERIVPEWYAVRNKPQRNAYHTFTVDRHLLETAGNAAGLTDRTERPDLLVVGALLHDIGKGYPGDHTDVGIGIVGTMATRMGFDDGDVEMLQMMVRHHLLLPDVAVRRDLTDDGTIQMVAKAVGTRCTLQLLDGLTEADSRATGPAAWNSWKAELVAQLVTRTDHVLGGGSVDEVIEDRFPTAADKERMGAGARVVEGAGDRLKVISRDRPGMFSRVAGALALHGLDVLEATAYSDDTGMAIEVFRVESSFGSPIDWARVGADIDRALDGRLALQARLSERARLYGRAPRAIPERVKPNVLVDNEISSSATVVQVTAPDRIGVLYRITRAIAELDLDLRNAKVQTLGSDVVDSFYVRTNDGAKVLDAAHLAEVERAIVQVIGE